MERVSEDKEDEVIDLSAGYSTRIAKLYYTRELDSGTKFNEFYNLAKR
jgi:hypothetical protein